MERRTFLQLAGLGVLGAAGCSGGRRAVAAGAPSVSGLPPAPVASSTAASGPPDWNALARSLAGSLVRPGDSNYDTARELYNTRFDTIRPQAVAQCANPHDVSECLSFVKRYNIPLALRAGGHNYAGWSTGTGLVVDVGPMNSVKVADGHLVAGAGVRLIDAYAAAAAAKVGIPAGSCPTVGITGLALGGGIGVLTRAWSVTSDNITSVDIVTADGKHVTCDDQRNSDLFWALRGAGGGNFGVVTSLTVRTRPIETLRLFFLHWPWNKAANVLAGWQKWLTDTPDELWSNLHLLSQPSGTPVVTVGGTYLGDTDTLNNLLNRLYAAVGSDPSSHSVSSKSYLDAMMLEAGCSTKTVMQCHLPSENPQGQLSRETFAAKSAILNKPLDTAGINAAIAGINDIQSRGDAGGGAALFDALGGAVSRVPATATAFVHRKALASIQYYASWSRPSLEKGSLDWLRRYHDNMENFTSGEAYQNYVDPDLADWEKAYYGENYPRLQKIKAKYDPRQLFKFPQSIKPV